MQTSFITIASVIALSGFKHLIGGNGSPAKHRKKVFKAFLKKLTESPHAIEAEIKFLESKQKTHLKFSGKNRFTGQRVVWFTSKSSSDRRIAENRRTELRHLMGISDIPKQYFDF